MSEKTLLLPSTTRQLPRAMCACCSTKQANYTDFVASEAELHGIQRIMEACTQPVVENSTETAELLRRLWAALQPWQSDPQAPRQCPGAKHPAWKCIGFQSETPLTDVRSAGLLGLQLLVHVAEQYPPAAQLAHASDTQYPFCAAVLDSAFMMCAALKLLPSKPTFCPAVGTAIRLPDSATRRDIQGFLLLVQASDAPITVLQEVLLATCGQVQVGWDQLKITLLAGKAPESMLTPSIAPESAVSSATSPLATAAAGAAAGCATPPTAILYFKHALQFARRGVLQALAELPSSVAEFRVAAQHETPGASMGALTPLPSDSAPRGFA